ncbi:MAG: methionine--tRNA ligase subunit beta [Candidatus Omnitrophota bacterium]|jgi:methionyl-tRNA synthetase
MATYEDFIKIELKIAKIIEAVEMPETNKLLKLKIDLGGEEKRQIVAGIKKTYKPEELIGREVVVVTNLDPRMVMGTESQGMVLCADDNGPILLKPDRDVPLGSKVK